MKPSIGCAVLLVTLSVGFVSSVQPSSTTWGSRAFYILFSYQVDQPDFPQRVCEISGSDCVDLRNYTNGVIIVSPANFTAAHTAKVKAAVPGARLLGYWDFGHMPWAPNASSTADCPCCVGTTMPMGNRPDRNCSTTYHCGPSQYTADIAATFSADDFVRSIVPNKRPEVYCGYPGLASYVPTVKSAPRIASFVASVVSSRSLDGIYLDGFGGARFNGNTFPKGVTADGTNQVMSVSNITWQGQAFGPAVVSLIRKNLPDSIIISNAGGILTNSDLNGLTIEMESCKERQICVDGFQAVQLAAHQPAVSVMWLTHSETVPAAQQCAFLAELRKAYFNVNILGGTDFFDGSHVTC